jgi:D-alanyl-D-alanine carboxypeptidase (penicillin-binding protein 5/6)
MFLSQMNRKAKSLNMFNSFFANPHGLSQTNNLSTAEDMAKLCSHCLKDDLFRRVVNTKVYKANYELLEPHIIKETDEYG